MCKIDISTFHRSQQNKAEFHLCLRLSPTQCHQFYHDIQRLVPLGFYYLPYGFALHQGLLCCLLAQLQPCNLFVSRVSLSVMDRSFDFDLIYPEIINFKNFILAKLRTELANNGVVVNE
jgi:hypothetical protein